VIDREFIPPEKWMLYCIHHLGWLPRRFQKMCPRSNFDKRVYLGGVGKTYKSIKKTMEGDSA